MESEASESLPTDPPARGLELIYQVAEELATRIADEKRYEGIIKPCSVKIARISDSSQFKIIRDSELIADENCVLEGPLTDQQSNGLSEEMQLECQEASDDEEEVIIPPENEEVINEAEETATFFCIFCPEKSILGKSKAFDHYQDHLDYYPFKCTQCLEVTTNLKNLFIHYRKDHSEEKTATFRRDAKPWMSEWIESFLVSQISRNCRGINKNSHPMPYCPVCESSEKKEDIVEIPPNLIQPRKQLLHVYKHLIYEPYVCTVCQKEGQIYTVNDFDDRAYAHIMKKHPQCEDSSLSEVFHKSRYIKPLERYIDHYLTSAGVSTKCRKRDKIPNSKRNKLKPKGTRERESGAANPNQDPNRSVTLADLVNHPPVTSLFLNNQMEPLIPSIGQSGDTLNPTKVNHNVITPSPHQVNFPPPVRQPVTTMLTTSTNSFILAPSKGPTTQYTNYVVPNLPTSNCLSMTSVSILPSHHTINGITTSQPIIVTASQPTNFIQLPCGQIMVRTNNGQPHMVVQSPPKIPSSPTKATSILRSPPAILRKQPSIISPPKAIQNGPVEVQIAPDVATGNGNAISCERRSSGEFILRSYFCPFCKMQVTFESYEDGLFHFSKYMDYHPFICLLCNQHLSDTNEIMDHFVSSHSHESVCRDTIGCEPLLYYINRDGEIEKWIERFIDFQVSGDIDSYTSCEFESFCFVCASLSKKIRIPTRSTDRESKITLPPIEEVRQHINMHLNYRPYECFLCSRKGDYNSFTAIGETALDHLKSVHGFSPNDPGFIQEFFTHKPIHRLESLVKSYLITELYPLANFNCTKPQEKLVMNGKANPKNYSKPGENLSKRLFSEVENCNGSSSPASSLSPPASQGHKLKRFASSPFACYHCRSHIIGVRELVSHCKKIHPNLSIASYCLPTIN